MNLAPIPPAIAAAFASFVVVFILKKWGDKLNPKDSAILDRVIDVATMVAGASVIASLSVTPLIKSLSSIFRAGFDLLGATATSTLGIGVGIVTLIVAGGVAVLLGIRFEKSEKWIDLLWFGLAVLAASVTFPWVNDVLSWWTNNAVSAIWNLLVAAVNLLLNINFNVAA